MGKIIFLMRVFILLSLLHLAKSTPPLGSLFGIRQPANLIQVDVKSAAESVIGQLLPSEVTTLGVATLDGINGIYYFIGYNGTSKVTSVIGLSLTSGQIVKNIELPILQDSTFIGVGQAIDFNQISGNLIITGKDMKHPQKHSIFSVDPSSGATSVIYSATGVTVVSGVSAFDSQQNIEWIELASNNSDGQLVHNFVGINVIHGTNVGTIEVPENMASMNFDSNTGLMVGIGLSRVNSTTSQRCIVTLNTKTQKYTTKPLPIEYEQLFGSSAALDVTGRFMSSYLALRSDPNTYYLVTSDLDGNVVSQPKACSNEFVCPWSIEYFNGVA